MFKDPLGWFPNPFFTNVFPIAVLAAFLIDYLVPGLTKAKGDKPIEKGDRGSYIVIHVAVLVGLMIGILIRRWNLGTWSGLFQWIGLLVLVAGVFIRGWALIRLGRFFSRTVQIESGHKIIKEGPYRWIRHPAYTGMILIDTGAIMGIGTWLGALVTFTSITGSLLYRISVEEKILLRTFGDEYQKYMTQTWKLFPGW